MYYTTYYSNAKNNDWVVFIHGIGGNINTYKKQIDVFKDNFNLLLIDLYGHGGTEKSLHELEDISFKEVSKQIILLMDKLNIPKAHFLGISLGSMIIRVVGELYPERVQTMVTGGTIVEYNLLSKLIFTMNDLTKSFVPKKILYNLFGLILMPRKNHKIARKYFCREALKAKKKDIFGWMNLMKTFDKKYPPTKLKDIKVPKLYIMGNEDHMFYNSCKIHAETDSYAQFITLNCGHVPHIENPAEFNKNAIEFVLKHSIYSKDTACILSS